MVRPAAARASFSLTTGAWSSSPSTVSPEMCCPYRAPTSSSLPLHDRGANLVLDLGRHHVHAVLVTGVAGDLLQDLVLGLGLEPRVAPRDDLAAPEFLHSRSSLVSGAERTAARSPRRPARRGLYDRRRVPRARVPRRADLARARALRDGQLARPSDAQPADDEQVPQ